jgi:hypothetical protein
MLPHVDLDQLDARVNAIAETWGRSFWHTTLVLLARGVRDAESMAVCRDCGCTDHDPCTGPDGRACFWVEQDLCSVCAAKEEETTTKNTEDTKKE